MNKVVVVVVVVVVHSMTHVNKMADVTSDAQTSQCTALKFEWKEIEWDNTLDRLKRIGNSFGNINKFKEWSTINETCNKSEYQRHFHAFWINKNITFKLN